MFGRLIVIIILLSGCRSGLIDCPENRGPKVRQTLINTKKLRVEDLYVSSNSHSDKEYERSVSRLKAQKHELKDPSTIEEWDCPRPGHQKNDRIVKNNMRRMEKKMQADINRRREMDSLSAVPLPDMITSP